MLDFVHDRYQIPTDLAAARSVLHWLLVATILVPCFVYLLNQYVAFSSTLNAISDEEFPKWQGALIFAAILIFFETVGGLKAVALTDVVQGMVLLFGCVMVWVFAIKYYGGINNIARKLPASHTMTMKDDAVIGSAEFWLVVGLQRALFPDYQSRVLAADGQRSLRYGTVILLVMPFLVQVGRERARCALALAPPSETVPFLTRARSFAQVPLGLLGLIGVDSHPDESANQVFARVIVDIIAEGGWSRFCGSLMLAASIAAIMSTADSILIEVSKIVTCDVFKPLLAAARHAGGGDGNAAFSERDERALTFLGYFCTTLLALLCVFFNDKDWDLSRMIMHQGVVLSAMGPTFLYGLYWPSMTGRHACISLVWGVTAGVYARLFATRAGHLIVVIAANFYLTAMSVVMDACSKRAHGGAEGGGKMQMCGHHFYVNTAWAVGILVYSAYYHPINGPITAWWRLTLGLVWVFVSVGIMIGDCLFYDDAVSDVSTFELPSMAPLASAPAGEETKAPPADDGGEGAGADGDAAPAAKPTKPMPAAKEPILYTKALLVAAVACMIVSLPWYLAKADGDGLIMGYPRWALTGLLLMGAAHLCMLGAVAFGWWPEPHANDVELHPKSAEERLFELKNNSSLTLDDDHNHVKATTIPVAYGEPKEA